MNTHPSLPMRDQLTLETLDPCAWRYVLTMDDLASYRLTTRSDVIGTWEIDSTTYYHFYCKVKVRISAQCFTHSASKSGKSYNGEQSDKMDSAPVMHTRVFLLLPEATRLTKSAFAALKKDTTQPSGASRAHHESQQGEVPYAHFSWCKEALKTRSMLEEHYYSIHHVVLQPSCCAPPSVFQTIMGKELQLRQQNFGCFSTQHVFLREDLRHEHAKDILGATCTVLEDKTKVWYVKMSEFVELERDQPSLKTPLLHMLEDGAINLSDYLDDPTDLVLCVPEQDHDH